MTEKRELEMPDGSVMDVTGASEDQIRTSVRNYMAQRPPAMTYRPPEASAIDPNLPQTAFGRSETAQASMESAAKSSQAVLENFGMIGATMLVPEVAIPAAVAKYGPAAKLVYQATLRSGAAGLGRGTGTAAGQELKRQMAPDLAPASAEEAWSQQWASAKEGAWQQASMAEAALPAAAKTASATVGAIAEKKLFESSNVVTNMRRRAALESERASEMAKLTEGAAKAQAMAQARNDAEQIAAEIGPLISRETSRSNAGQLKTAIETRLNQSEKARYLALDKASAISMTPSGPGKVDTQPIVDRFVELAKEIPVGSGFWSEWTKLPPDIAAPMRAALRQEAKIAKAAASVEEATAAQLSAKGAGPASGGIAPETVSESLKDLVSSLNDLTNAQAAHGAAPVSVLLRARAAMSRAKADPATSDDLRAILDEMIPSLKTRKTGPVDDAINKGLADVNPTLVGEFQEAKQYWHQAETTKRMVLYKIFQKTGDAKPLADYIGPNDPQAVTRVRILLQDVGQEAQWPAIQKEVFTNLILGRDGNVDLMGLSRRLNQWGDSTISQLTRAGNGARDATMVARVDALKNLSNKYAKLNEAEEPILTSRRLDQIDVMLDKLSGGSSFRDAVKSAMGYMVSPHVLAGITLGRVFGWGPALYGGVASAGLKQGADAIIRLAYDPVRLNMFTKHMEAFVQNGDATAITNMARLADAALKSGPAAQAAGQGVTNLLRSSHSSETQ